MESHITTAEILGEDGLLTARICACLSLRTGFSQELMKVKEPQNYKDILPTLYSVMLWLQQKVEKMIDREV